MQCNHDELNLGDCCVCGSDVDVTNLILIPRLAPIPGEGWGCTACGLPNDGAIAVLCDECIRSNANFERVCVGWPSKNQRIHVDQLGPEPFSHDYRKHPDQWWFIDDGSAPGSAQYICGICRHPIPAGPHIHMRMPPRIVRFHNRCFPPSKLPDLGIEKFMN